MLGTLLITFFLPVRLVLLMHVPNSSARGCMFLPQSGPCWTLLLSPYFLELHACFEVGWLPQWIAAILFAR